MQLSLQLNGRMSLAAFFLLLTSLFSIAIAAPLAQPAHNVSATVTERAPTKTKITYAQYTDYLKQYYPDTTKYMLFSGGSYDQAAEFGRLNANFYQYYDFYDPVKSTTWSKAFDSSKVKNDPIAASQAIAMLATDTIWVFGAVQYKQYPDSFYFKYEAPPLISNYGGSLKTINHMNKGAAATTDVLATEDKTTITYLHDDGSSNASGAYGDCSTTTAPPTCDVPDPNDGSNDN